MSFRLIARRCYSSAPRSIGFIGLGAMGLPMAKNLLKSSATLNLFDTNPAAFASFPASQIQKCSSPADVSSRSDLIITMLPMGKHVRDVYMGENGILVGLKEGTICIDSSTIDVKTTKDVAESVAKKGGVMVDAPVSGGVNGATAGTLTFMIGASASAFECIKPVLSFMGKNIVYCGPNGHGQIAKICNNMLLGISMLAVSETLNLGVNLGMDPKLLSGIIQGSSGSCWSNNTYNPVPGVMENVPSSRDYNGGFGISLMRKDMGLAVEAARESGSPVLLAGVAGEFYQIVSNDKQLAKKDFSVVYKVLNK